MTRQELDDAIDLILNDSIPDESLSPSDEAGVIKLVADYADQQTPYNFWRGKINISTLLVSEILHDGISLGAVTISNPSNGVIRLTKSGLSLPGTKLDLLSSTINNGGVPFITNAERDTISVSPDHAVNVNIFDMTGGQTTTPSAIFTLEIRIYN